MRRPTPWTGAGGGASARVVLVSPETLFGEALSICLASNDGLDVVGLAIDVATVAEAVAVLKPGVLVCDQRAAGHQLLDLVAECRRAHDPLRTVLLATLAAPTTAETAAFDAVVPPRSALDRVVATVREVAWYRDVPVPSPDVHAPELTAREAEVLNLLARGVGTAGIAGQLHISPHTVRNHVRRLTGKLGVGSRIEAITEGRRVGLV